MKSPEHRLGWLESPFLFLFRHLQRRAAAGYFGVSQGCAGVASGTFRGLAYGIPQWNYSMEKVEYPWNVECLETAKLKLSKYSEYPYVLEARFEYSRKSKVRSHQSV